MISIQIINSGALADAMQSTPRDLPVIIQGEGVEGPYLLRSVEIRDYYRGREDDKALLLDPATSPRDGREVIRVLVLK